MRHNLGYVREALRGCEVGCLLLCEADVMDICVREV